MSELLTANNFLIAVIMAVVAVILIVPVAIVVIIILFSKARGKTTKN